MAQSSHPLFLDATRPRARMPRGALPLLNLVVAVAYMAGAYVGLKLAFVGDFVTLFWPPSGLAFAAIWMGGAWLLPGIGLGAFAINLIISGDPVMAALVACGSMAAPFVGISMLRRVLVRDADAGELRRVLLFILTALGSTLISATAGTFALVTTASVTDSAQLPWLIWWLGDAMGVLIIAPPILLWRNPFKVWPARRTLSEVGALAIAVAMILAVPLVMEQPIWASQLGALGTLLLCLLAAARFGLHGPAWMMLLITAGTIGVTLLGAGPFQRGDFYDNFALVHSHLFTVALAGMLLAATLADMRRTILREMQARAAAEDAAVSRVRLLTMISHDVRTPLSGMVTVLQTLDRATIPPELGRLVGLGLRAGQTLTSLVTHILDAARADAGRITLIPAPFSPARSLADIQEFSRPLAQAKGLAIQLSCAGEVPPLLLGDRVRFEQLVGNLVTNAVAYTPRGGVSIEARWDAAGGGALVVEVADTGGGMDPARIPRMFDAPAMGDHVAIDTGGLGLGLHICRRLTELMGGRIGYTPEPQGGSRFRVDLPLPAHHAASAAPASATDPALRILLVEDDEIAGETTRALLQSAGHETVLATDGGSALACLAQEGFDLVLLDLGLGGEGASGLDVVRALRAHPDEKGRIRTVALTADGQAGRHAALKAAGFDGVIVKPLMLGLGVTATVEAALWPALSAPAVSAAD